MYASGQVAHIQVEPAVTADPLLRVLVIDDDESVGAAIKVFLARRRCRTELASGAYAGIQALAQSSFDVVLVDLFMTGMSGLDAIAYIRQRSAVPIVAMSGFRLRSSLEPVDYLRTALQRGASRYLRKPFSSHELIEAIDLSLPPHAHSGVLLR
ncbi:response regulator [Bradyrhizobium sp. HKCCYLS3077]|uniref:response regulator n=1 Tax=Bradyrhizobium sp. HKCCYLS3077 TaxID=3420761 RepID=UPI003EBDFEB9